jgi:hypothetical protein
MYTLAHPSWRDLFRFHCERLRSRRHEALLSREAANRSTHAEGIRLAYEKIRCPPGRSVRAASAKMLRSSPWYSRLHVYAQALR